MYDVTTIVCDWQDIPCFLSEVTIPMMD
jgi:hypothetical protein